MVVSFLGSGFKKEGSRVGNRLWLWNDGGGLELYDTTKLGPLHCSLIGVLPNIMCACLFRWACRATWYK